MIIDTRLAESLLMRFLAVEGVTGQEKAIGQEVVAALTEIGVPRSAIRFDNANERIPLPTETGNLIVKLAGSGSGPRRLFATHLDTVPLCAGAKPIRKGKRILAAGKTALGGDNRTGCAILLTLAAMLRKHQLPHPPLTLLFTVREESGLWGARFVELEELGNPALGFNFDGRSPYDLTIGAVGAERWAAEIVGKAAHAGVHPEQGISASLVAALALADVQRGGWFGLVRQNEKEGTSNVGSIGDKEGKSAGVATNVVTDYTLVKGECRSHDDRFVRQITRAYRDAFRAAASQVRNDKGKRAKLRFQVRRDYYPFRLQPTAAVVQHAVAAAKSLGIEPTLRATNGGLDANWLVRHGVPTVTIGAGQNNIHTVDEYVELPDFHVACQLAVALATDAA